MYMSRVLDGCPVNKNVPVEAGGDSKLKKLNNFIVRVGDLVSAASCLLRSRLKSLRSLLRASPSAPKRATYKLRNSCISKPNGTPGPHTEFGSTLQRAHILFRCSEFFW